MSDFPENLGVHYDKIFQLVQNSLWFAPNREEDARGIAASVIRTCLEHHNDPDGQLKKRRREVPPEEEKALRKYVYQRAEDKLKKYKRHLVARLADHGINMPKDGDDPLNGVWNEAIADDSTISAANVLLDLIEFLDKLFEGAPKQSEKSRAVRMTFAGAEVSEIILKCGLTVHDVEDSVDRAVKALQKALK